MCESTWHSQCSRRSIKIAPNAAPSLPVTPRPAPHNTPSEAHLPHTHIRTRHSRTASLTHLQLARITVRSFSSRMVSAKMTSSGSKRAMVGLVLVALLLVCGSRTTQAAVTVINPAGINVDVLVNGNVVKVIAGMVNVDVKGKGSQVIQVKGPNGKNVDVNVHDGDVLVLVPDLSGKGDIVVSVNGKSTP